MKNNKEKILFTKNADEIHTTLNKKLFIMNKQ